jgi:hypothetical protein
MSARRNLAYIATTYNLYAESQTFSMKRYSMARVRGGSSIIAESLAIDSVLLPAVLFPPLV